MLRIAMYLGTNLAIMAVLSVVFSLLGINSILQQNGIDLDLERLLIYAIAIGFSGSIISLFLSKRMAKRSMRVHVIETPQNSTEKWLMDCVTQQAKQAGIGMPEVGIFESATPNAFATGWNKNNALVAVSTGLLQQMTDEEAEAVMAHEISHVANGDMVTMCLIQGVLNTFVIFLARILGFLVDRIVFKVERGHGPAFWIASMIFELILGFLASMIAMWFSRYREFRADAGGANLAGKQAMINALKRLQSAHGTPDIPDEMAAFAINAGKIRALFSSHPPLEKRIAVLEQRAD